MDQLNTILLLIGVEARDDGKLHEVEAAKTLTEVQVRINSLTHEIKFRHLHFELFKYCSVEFLNEDYFHACFESVKGVLERIRSLTKLSLDGAKLLDVVFSKDKPSILINDFKTENDKNEFLGLKDLIMSLVRMVRNPDAHMPRANSNTDLDETLEVLTYVSRVHRYLDKATTTCFVNEK